MNCDEHNVKSISSISTAAFPTSMTRAWDHNLAYSSLTQTLVYCGGTQVGILYSKGEVLFLHFFASNFLKQLFSFHVKYRKIISDFHVNRPWL